MEEEELVCTECKEVYDATEESPDHYVCKWCYTG